jgi:hypothetical protein
MANGMYICLSSWMVELLLMWNVELTKRGKVYPLQTIFDDLVSVTTEEYKYLVDIASNSESYVAFLLRACACEALQSSFLPIFR